MSWWLLTIVTVCYLGTGLDYAIAEEWWKCIFWASYGVANIAYMKVFL